MNSDSTFNTLTREPPNLESLKQLQGEVRIETYQPLKRNWYKTLLLLPLVSICSVLIVPVLMRKRKDISAALMYDKCNMEQATHVYIVGNDKSMEIVDHVEPTFFYRKLKYISRSIHPYPLNYKLADSLFFSLPESYKQSGLTEQQAGESRSLYGLCEHTVDVPTLWAYLAEQMFGIFYILQYITCAIYILQNFISFGVILISVSLLTTIINYFFLRSSYLKIKELAEHTTIVTVIRDGNRQEIQSVELVPGDIFEPDGLIPCDCILIQGEIYVNQASLTGESVPISKTAVKVMDDTQEEKAWLFEGSMVLEKRGRTLALAVNTGYITRRGRIFRKILYRDHQEPEFYKTAFFLLLEMLFYCTVIFLGTIGVFLAVQITPKLIILRFFDMVGWAIPPSFPIAFNICYSLSLYRLRKQGILGTEPYKTIVSGKVTTVCFDKTGTLTQNAMQLNSIVKFTKQGKHITVKSTQKLPVDEILAKLMASCHTVRKVAEEFMGDELDLRMFLYSGYEYHVPEDDHSVALNLTFGDVKLQVMRINQFESKFQAMSVLIKDCSTNRFYIFVKGAPQKIQKVSTNKVQGFEDLLSNVSLAGLRCLALAYRQVVDYREWQKCDRLQFEQNLIMIGLVTFDNKLKDDTIQTITNLREAEIKTKIITGDNIYIAVETAIRSGILDSKQNVLIFRGEAQSQEKNNEFIGELLSKELDGSIRKKEVVISAEELQQRNKTSVAIDNAFLHLCPFIPKNTKIFARITPQSKAQVIKKEIQEKKFERQMKTKWERVFGRTLEKVAMVGDGANDIMAIKQADLGIGISDTDSSFAANFSVSELMNVDYILREGKSTLSIIIDLFCYFGSMSIVKYLGNHILIWDKSSFNDNQFTYCNYGSTIQIVGFLSLSYPGPILSRFIPNDNLMALQNRLVFIGNIIIPVAGLITVMAIVVNDSVFVSNPVAVYDNWVFSCVTNTAIFLPSHLFYIWNTFWTYTTQPWKLPIYYNYVLFVWLVVIIILNSVLYFFTSSLSPFFMFVELPKRMEGILFGVTYGFVFLGFIWRIIINSLRLHTKN